jgi:hypothetical protein
VVPATARTRYGNKALKPATSRSLPSGEAQGGWQRQEGTGPERGADRSEGKPLKGEAHGRSGALVAPGGLVVNVAQGVTKPRTRHAVVEGSTAGKRIRRPETVS